MKRIEITRGIVGIYAMQVCAEQDVTDEEVLAVCNRENPAGTELGWTQVARADFKQENLRPVACNDDPGRLHLIAVC